MLLEGSVSHHSCWACVTRDETQPSVVWMVLKVQGKSQVGDAVSLNVRHPLGLFFLIDLFPSLPPPTHSSSSSLPAPGLSLSPLTTPTLGTSHSVSSNIREKMPGGTLRL